MRLTASFLALALVAGSPALADEGSVGPRLHIEDEEIRFGDVVQGEVVELRVPIENRGDAPLHIRWAEPTCGCTVSRCPEEPIPPGGSADLELRFDSSDRSGTVAFEVHIYADDPTQTDRGPYCTVLRVQGGVRDLYRLSPRGAYFGQFVRGGAPAERTIRVTGTGPASEGFEPRVEGALPDWLEADARPVAGEAGVAEVHIRLLPHAPAGDLLREVVVGTGLEVQPRFRIPVAGVVVGAVHAPSYVLLQPGAGGLEEPRRIPLERQDGRDGVPVRRVEADPSLLSVDVEPLTPRRVDLHVSLAPDAPVGPFATVLRVHLDVPEQPVVEVPVYGRVPPPVSADPAGIVLRDGRGGTVIRGAEVTALRVEPADAGITARRVEAEGAGQGVEVAAARPLPEGAALVVETVAGAVRVPVREVR